MARTKKKAVKKPNPKKVAVNKAVKAKLKKTRTRHPSSPTIHDASPTHVDLARDILIEAKNTISKFGELLDMAHVGEELSDVVTQLRGTMTDEVVKEIMTMEQPLANAEVVNVPVVFVQLMLIAIGEPVPEVPDAPAPIIDDEL
jgi:hypothetical protein